MNKNIFIAAHARSGSTYLCSLLENTQEIKVYLEIFHFNIDVINEHLRGDFPNVSQHLDLECNTNSRAKLVKNCGQYIDCLNDINNGKTIAYKVFSDHLPDVALEKVIKDIGKVIIYKRNLLHSYISGEIAKNIQKWSVVDTSKNHAEFNEMSFFHHVRSILDYYDRVVKLANTYEKQLIFIDYEELSNLNNPFKFLLKKLSNEDYNISDGGNKKIVNLVKQDKRKKACDKVSNPLKMEAFLFKYDLDSLNEASNNVQDEVYCEFLKNFLGKPL